MSSSYAPLPTIPSSSRTEPRSGPFLLEAHCRQSSSLVEDLVREDTAPSVSSISALDLAHLINDPGEIINASFPRLSALLTDADEMLAVRRIDELSVQLEQASKLLQELIADFLPETAAEQENEPIAAQTIPEPELRLADVPADSTATTDISTKFEHRRVMAMAA